MTLQRRERDWFILFVSVMVGVVGSLLVSCIIEMAKLAFEKFNIHDTYSYWAIIFILSSTFFFQLTKWAIRRLGVAQRELPIFDIATIILIVVGIFAIAIILYILRP